MNNINENEPLQNSQPMMDNTPPLDISKPEQDITPESNIPQQAYTADPIPPPVFNPPPPPIFTPPSANNNQPTNQGGVNMRCMRCGNFTTTPFCPLCGFNVKDGLANGYQNQYYQQYQPQKKSSNVGIILGISIPVFLVLVLIGMIVLGRLIIIDEKSSDSNSQPNYYGNDFSFFDNESNKDQPSDNKYIPNGVSDDEFDKIKEGMSYAQVSSIIGGDGMLIDQGRNIHKKSYYTYGWIGEDNNQAELYITFVEGEVSEIELEGDL